MSERLALSAKSLLFEFNLGEIQKLLTGQGIQVLVLKGPHLAATLYDKPTDRKYSDLDILVDPEHYYQAAQALLEGGFRLSGIRSGWLASDKADYQLLLRSPRGIAVELHRALADTSQYRSDVRGFFARSEEFTFGELKCRGLGTEDLLLHLCLHFGKRHFMTSEKKHLLDISLLLKKKNVDWPLFVARANAAGCKAICFYGLEAARLQHGADMPAEAHAALRPGPLRRRFLARCLDPASFPIYRFAGRPPGPRERLANLALLDRMPTMAASLLRFFARRTADRMLRVGPIRRVWLRRHPLRPWLPCDPK